MQPRFHNYQLILQNFVLGQHNLYFSCHLRNYFFEITQVSLTILSYLKKVHIPTTQLCSERVYDLFALDDLGS